MKTMHLKTLLPIGLACCLLACQPAEESKQAQEGTPLAEEDKVAYAMGSNIAEQINKNMESFTGLEIVVNKDVISRGFNETLKGKSQLTHEQRLAVLQQFQKTFQEKQMAQQAIESKDNLEKGTAFLTANKAKEGVVTLESGMQYKVLEAGKGGSPKATDKVRVHYQGTLIDGTKFDSSYDRKEPITFPVNGVIQGWQEALQLMKEGAKWQLFIPANLAYGPQGRPGIPGNSVLLFDVELLKVNPEEEN